MMNPLTKEAVHRALEIMTSDGKLIRPRMNPENHITRLSRQRKAMFVECRMLGMSPTWAAYYVSRRKKTLKQLRSELDDWVNVNSSSDKVWMNECVLVPADVLDALGIAYDK